MELEALARRHESLPGCIEKLIEMPPLRLLSLRPRVRSVPAATDATQWTMVPVRSSSENIIVLESERNMLNVYGGWPPCQVNVCSAHSGIGSGESIFIPGSEARL